MKIRSENKFPEGAVKFMKAEKLAGNVFNEFDWGEYITWNLYPECKVAIDGRYDTVYSVPFLKNYFDPASCGIEIPKNSDFLLLRPARKIGAIKWRKIYRDEISVLYTKRLTNKKN